MGFRDLARSLNEIWTYDIKYLFGKCTLKERKEREEYYTKLALGYLAEALKIIKEKEGFDGLTIEDQAIVKANRNLARRCERATGVKLAGMAHPRSRDYQCYMSNLEEFLEASKRDSSD